MPAVRTKLMAPPTKQERQQDCSALVRLEISAAIRAFFSESTAFIVCCIYLMFEYVRPQSIYSFLDFLPFAQISLLLGVVLAFLERRADRQPIYGSQWALLIAYLTVAAVSMMFSGGGADGWPTLQLIIAWYLAVYLITATVTTERRFIIFYMLFLLFSFKMSQHGFRSWVGRGFAFDRLGVHGAPGWFHNSGEVGVQMCIFLPMALHFVSAGWRQWTLVKRLVMCIVPITIVGTILGSSSRGALVGSAAALVWMLFQTKGNRVRSGALVISIALASAVLLPAEFVGRMTSIGEDWTSVTRLRYWAFGWQMALENPLLGIGLGNWLSVWADHVAANGLPYPIELPHNIFVYAAAELGFTGLIVLALIVLSTFRLNRATRSIAESNGNEFLRHAAMGLDAGMIGYLVSAMFVTVLYYPYLWIALAMTVALHNVARRSIPVEPALPRPVTRRRLVRHGQLRKGKRERVAL